MCFILDGARRTQTRCRCARDERQQLNSENTAHSDSQRWSANQPFTQNNEESPRRRIATVRRHSTRPRVIAATHKTYGYGHRCREDAHAQKNNIRQVATSSRSCKVKYQPNWICGLTLTLTLQGKREQPSCKLQGKTISAELSLQAKTKTAELQVASCKVKREQPSRSRKRSGRLIRSGCRCRYIHIYIYINKCM